jgi:hypothetical protein
MFWVTSHLFIWAAVTVIAGVKNGKVPLHKAIYHAMNTRFIGSRFHTFGDWSDQERRTFHTAIAIKKRLLFGFSLGSSFL